MNNKRNYNPNRGNRGLALVLIAIFGAFGTVIVALSTAIFASSHTPIQINLNFLTERPAA